jgi:hypothetical protein
MSTMIASLTGEIVAVPKLDDDARTAMLELMTRYFAQLDPVQFHRDLNAKPWAILLRAPDGALAGFSTLDIMEARVDGRLIRAIYSGDTITDRSYWSTSALPHAFLLFVAKHTGVDRDEAEWFWFYVCKGFRTYRFLPVFYRSFFPHPNFVTPPFEQAVLNHLAAARFGAAYDPSQGVVRVPEDYSLKCGIGDVTPQRERDPFIRFFAEHNPGWPRGEELVCIASLTRSNLNARPQRWLDEESQS